ncbi:TPA: replication protein, partial [Enterococcus faecium]
MSKNGIIVNEWENLTALSNRRLNVKTFYTPLKIRWSIDRITIVGKLKENIYYHTQN